mgnify:CR=1 FL=1
MKFNCKELKILINAYLDNELSNEDKELMEQHLQSCKQCQDEAMALQKTIYLIKNLNKISAPAELEHRLNSAIEQKMKSSLIVSFLPMKLSNNISFKMIQIASIITLSLLICFIFILFINKDVNYISQLSPEERYLNNPLPTVFNADEQKIEQFINNEELSSKSMQNNNDNYLMQSPYIDNNKPSKEDNMNLNKPSASEKTATEIASLNKNNNIGKLQNQSTNNESIRSNQKTPIELNSLITQLSRYSLNNNFLIDNDKADITVYAHLDEIYNKIALKNTKSHQKNLYKYESKYSDNTFKKTKELISEKSIPEIILVPVNFIYNFNEPIIVMTRIYFTENKSIKKIEFLSNSLDSRMKILLLKSLKNYNWKDYLIRYNLQGISYEMDFILANEGMTLWNIEEQGSGLAI